VLGFVDAAAESPMESRLRMVLVLGGLPRPRAQVTIRDRWGRALGRPDLYYAEQRLGIEYDGGSHRESLTEDNRRQNRLLKAGVRLLRFTAADVLRNPEGVVSQVQAVLSATDPTPRLPALAGFTRPD
jgi:very-short-patch-repair endonuclease